MKLYQFQSHYALSGFTLSDKSGMSIVHEYRRGEILTQAEYNLLRLDCVDYLEGSIVTEIDADCESLRDITAMLGIHRYLTTDIQDYDFATKNDIVRMFRISRDSKMALYTDNMGFTHQITFLAGVIYDERTYNALKSGHEADIIYGDWLYFHRNDLIRHFDGLLYMYSRFRKENNAYDYYTYSPDADSYYKQKIKHLQRGGIV